MSKNRRKNALSAFIHLTTHKVSHIFPYNYYNQCVIFPHHPHFFPINCLGRTRIWRIWRIFQPQISTNYFCCWICVSGSHGSHRIFTPNVKSHRGFTHLCSLWLTQIQQIKQKNRGFRVFDKPQISTNFHKLFFCWILLDLCELWKSEYSEHSDMPTTFLPNSVRFIIIKSKISEICGICVSQAPAPRPFHQPPWDLTSSKAKISERYLCELYPHIKCGGWEKR